MDSTDIQESRWKGFCIDTTLLAMVVVPLTVLLYSAFHSSLIVGAIAKLLMPGRDPGGIIITMILGIAGLVLASYLGQAIGWYQPGQPAGFIMSVAGAMLLLGIYHLYRRSRTA